MPIPTGDFFAILQFFIYLHIFHTIDNFLNEIMQQLKKL